MLKQLGKRMRGKGSVAGVVESLPTMRLITLANSTPDCGTEFGLAPLTTSAAMSTPIAHSAYELTELPTFTPRGPVRSMPWEEDDETFLKFRATLPDIVTPDAMYEHVAKPLLTGSDAPQRSEGWHLARAFAVTASQFASAANENPSMSKKKLLLSKTYPKANGFQGNAFTEWGTIHECHAEEAFVQFLCERKQTTAATVEGGDVHFGDGSKLTHSALKRDPSKPYIGFSPDALLWNADGTEVALVEYKCPAYQRSGPGHPYAAKNSLCVPRQYMPQLQGSLQILRACYPDVKCVRAWFVVWQAHQFFVTHVPYVDRFASRILDASCTFFQKQFLPACVEAVKQREATVKRPV